jgi:hypothetical protein
MAKLSDPELVALATRFSVPPPLVYGISVMASDKKPEAITESVRLVSEQFQQTHSWEGALGALHGGVGGVGETNPATGLVNATLGIAASRPQWGMQGWKPLDLNRFAAGAKAMEKTAKGLARLGGVVTPEHVNSWGMAITQVKHPTPPQGESKPWPEAEAKPPPVIPDLHKAKDVAQFASQLKALNVTPDHFKQLFPTVALLHRRLLGAKHVSVDDFAPHAGQTPDMVLKSVRDMPHHIYPEHTVGEMHDAYNAAQQYSLIHSKKSPSLKEVSRFVSAGMDHKSMEHYYATKSESQKPLVNEGGGGGQQQQAEPPGQVQSAQPQLKAVQGGKS